MGTVTVDQRIDALGSANQVRHAMSEIRHEIAAGETAIAAALFDPRAASLSIARLLTARRGWGNFRVRGFLSRLEIRETKRVWELTTRQRVLIIETLEARS